MILLPSPSCFFCGRQGKVEAFADNSQLARSPNHVPFSCAFSAVPSAFAAAPRPRVGLTNWVSWEMQDLFAGVTPPGRSVLPIHWLWLQTRGISGLLQARMLG